MNTNITSYLFGLSLPFLLLLNGCTTETIDVAGAGPITYVFSETRTFECDQPYDYEGLLITIVLDSLEGCPYRGNNPDCQSMVTDSTWGPGGVILSPSSLKFDLTQLSGYEAVEMGIGNYCGENYCMSVGFFDRRGNLLKTEPLRSREAYYIYEDLPEDLAYLLVPGCETFMRSVLVR